MPLKLDPKSLRRHNCQPEPVKIGGHKSKWTLQSDENDGNAKGNSSMALSDSRIADKQSDRQLASRTPFPRDFELKRFDTW